MAAQTVSPVHSGAHAQTNTHSHKNVFSRILKHLAPEVQFTGVDGKEYKTSVALLGRAH